MDILSGIIQCVLNEFEACDSEAMSIAFQNHLYGCFSIMEQHTENGSVLLDLSKDLSGTDPWTTLGIEYGFLEDRRAAYTGSDRYRSVMTELLLTLWTDEQVEELELLVFEQLRTIDAKYFITALEMSDLSGDLMAEINAALNIPVHKIQEAIVDLPPKPKTKTKFNNTRGHKSKTIGKTRRRKQIRGV